MAVEGLSGIWIFVICIVVAYFMLQRGKNELENNFSDADSDGGSATTCTNKPNAAFSPTKKIGTYFWVDNTNKKWCIPQGKLKKTVYPYSDIMDFELIEDGNTVTKGGLGRAVAGGLLVLTLTDGTLVDCGALPNSGISGTDGKDGVSITSATVDKQGHLILTLTDDRVLDCGLVTATEKEFTVSFDSAGGSAVEDQKVVRGDKVKRPKTPKRVGYEFLGWYVDDEKWSFIGYGVTEDMTITAKWRVLTDSWQDAFSFDMNSYTVKKTSADGSITYYRYTDGLIYRAVGANDNSVVWNFVGYDVVDEFGYLKNMHSIATPKDGSSFIYNIGEEAEVTFDESFRVVKVDLIDGEFYEIFDFDCTVAPENIYESGEGLGETNLIFELTKNSNFGELSSGCERYYAGASTGNYETIDTSIKNRNAAAYEEANVKLTYTYVGTDNSFCWGRNADRIFQQTRSESVNAPDMNCNFTYDLMCAMLKGSFANLYSTAYGNGGNFFRFTQPDYNPSSGTGYFDSAAGEGYFYQYMKSLTLSDDKMYLLASDYTTDVIRSMMVIPVNISMMNSISIEASTGDMTDDGKFDFRDFYELVWAGHWNYDALARYSNAVYKNNNIDKNSDSESAFGDTNLGDVIGFAAGASSGLTSSGILYSSSVKIINKTVNADGSWSFAYPTTNSELNALADALYNVFTDNASKGIVSITSVDARAYDSSLNETEGELIAIRNEFAKNNVLFGGVIAVGSLEDEVYQGMRKNDGFGIVPVPVYKYGDEYNTLIGQMAKPIAIAATTTEFEQCTAFLDYQSRNSAEILNMYYDEQLASKVEGAASSDNKQMLTYIRNHVRDCFDKTYEDVVSDFKGDTEGTAANDNKWHTQLQRSGFRLTDFSNTYNSLYAKKQADLNEVIEAWNKLP